MLGLVWADPAALLLGGAAIGWYVASHAAADALATGRWSARRRTLGLWVPIAVTAVVATLLGQSEIAIGILFATSVASLSLVLGIITCTHDFSLPSTHPGGFQVVQTTDQPSIPIAQRPQDTDRRLWAFVLPAALLALLAGFQGELTPTHALILLIQGLAMLLAWRVPPEEKPARPARSPFISAIEMLLAIGIAAVAGAAGVRAATEISAELGLVSGSFVAAMMLSPAMVLPLIGSGMSAAKLGSYPAAVTSSVGIVLLNLCLGLPIVVLLWQSAPTWEKHVRSIVTVASSEAPATGPSAADAPASPPLRFPLTVWRVDSVLLIVLGLVLLPLSVGRWLPGRFEGILMILGYIIYMGLATISARS
jgi:Ca2+/Na+ antiporter